MGKRTAEETSRIMSRIRGKDTAIECALRGELRRRGLHYRKNVRTLTGCPDVVFAYYRVAIFCDGEFWHGRDWARHKEDFRSNKAFWVEKIERNRARDRRVNATLRAQGWRVLRFWESDIQRNVRAVGAKVEAALVDALLARWRSNRPKESR